MASFYIDSIRYALSFYKDATSRYQVHSPYLYDFINDVFDSKKHHYCFPAIEILRKKLLKNNQSMNMVDFGAGSRKKNQPKQRKISEIARNSLSPPSQCRSMFWIINKMQPTNVIELGSSLGISTLYLALANKNSQIWSFEGNPDSIHIAKQQAELMKVKNINYIEGPFDDTLSIVVDKLDKLDVAFIDGNHQYQATLDYFNLFLPKLHENSILIFDDIYWSVGMKKAWEEIKEHPAVKASLDMYTYGIVFFKTNFKEKKHVKLLPVAYKPWQKLNL